MISESYLFAVSLRSHLTTTPGKHDTYKPHAYFVKSACTSSKCAIYANGCCVPGILRKLNIHVNFTFPESPLPVILSEKVRSSSRTTSFSPSLAVLISVSAHALDFSFFWPPPSCVSSSCLSLSSPSAFFHPTPFLKTLQAMASPSSFLREQCEGISGTLLRVVWPCGGPRLKHARSASLPSQKSEAGFKLTRNISTLQCACVHLIGHHIVST